MDARSTRWRRRPALRWPARTLVELDGSAHAQLRRHVFEVGATAEKRDAADAAVLECTDCFTGLIAAKRARPSDDLLSRLVTGEGVPTPGDRLDDAALNTLSSLLFMAAFETTTNLVGSGVLALLDLGEATIPAGEQVFLLLGAANRDPLRYADPERLGLTRTDIHPLSLGGGVHFCLGAALARLEIDVAFRRLVERWELVELQGARLPHRDRLSLRGPASVPLRLGGSEPVAASAASGAVSRTAGDDRSWRNAFRNRLEKASTAPDPVEVGALSALLGRIPLFAACQPIELEPLAATAYPIAFDDGDALCVQGADASDGNVVVEGEAAVTIDGEPSASSTPTRSWASAHRSNADHALPPSRRRPTWSRTPSLASESTSSWCPARPSRPTCARLFGRGIATGSGGGTRVGR